MTFPSVRSRFASSVVSGCILLMVAGGTPPVRAITVNVGDASLFPDSAEVIAATLAQTTFHDAAPDAPHALSQTFQVTSTFDLRSIYLVFGNSTAGDLNVGLQIFKVPDTLADPITTSPDVADILLDTSFLAPVAPDNTVMQLFLDSDLSLSATTGSEGYAIQLVDPDFRWDRTASAGNVYAAGNAFENGAAKTFPPGRDFSLALSSVGPPPPPIEFVTTVAGPSDMNSAIWDTTPTPTGVVAPTQATPPDRNRYTVQSGHTVTANTPFTGDLLAVASGGALQLATSAVSIPDLTIAAAGTLNNVGSPSGDFAVGDIYASPLHKLELNGTASFGATAGADLFVDVALSGTGDLNFQSNGAGSDLWLTAAGSHEGVIRFNGTGDQVWLVEDQAFGSLEMNSTGANRLLYDPSAQLTAGILVFNQPGVIDHAQSLASQSRLHGPTQLTVNAAVTVDLTKEPQGNERRLFVGSGGLAGSADITVNGTATDPTAGGITHNEFEVGSSGEPTTLQTNTYSGTIAGNDFVDLEIRHSLPDARLVINSNARLEMGHEAIMSSHSVELGEVQINSGGTLEIGYEADDQHNAYQLTLTSSGSRAGSLTLAGGSTTRMQVNGTAAGEFDSIVADGNVSLGGTLQILVNPAGSGGTNPTYTPTLGDTFDLFRIVTISPPGDYSGNGTVGPEDYDLWKADFGSTTALAADGNGNGVVDAADYVVWRDNDGATGGTVGTISGSIALQTVDPGNVMSGAGLAFELMQTTMLLQLQVVSAGSAAFTAVPEPSSLCLLLILATIGGSYRIGLRRQLHPAANYLNSVDEGTRRV